MTETDLSREIREQMPVAVQQLRLGESRFGLIVVDEVNGFATVGAGNLAPPTENAQVTRMVLETDRLARDFSQRGLPILAFLDTHEPGKPEPPYPPHCERGTGEENLVPQLKWLEDDPNATLIRKDCINGFVGAIDEGRNRFVDWIGAARPENLLVVGICTDICVMDFVLTAVSARNHGLLPGVSDIFVYDNGCATYDLPRGKAEELGYGAAAAHPQELTHHLGLYFMAARGAGVVDAVTFAG